MSNARPLKFMTFGDGCYVCVSHKLNHDGYFIKGWPDGREMFHRTIWRHHYGPIPDGSEVDHMCLNRACCNVNHLRVLTRKEHLIHTNTTRYLGRKEEAKEYWLIHKPTATKLAELFGVCTSAACIWVRQWSKKTKSLH
jgi:hypothetical protein